MTHEDLTDRRTVLRGAALIGMGAAVAACGGGSGGAAAGPSAPAGTELGKASDIPVGGGKIFAEDRLVVTQPSEGEFKAFSAVCTHQGCIVSSIEDEQIHCACHGSAFSIDDGSVAHGPADSPLKSAKVIHQSGTLTLG